MEACLTALLSIKNINKPLSASPSSQWQQGDATTKRVLGDTHNFCPVALKNHNVLWPCTDEIAAKYREKTFYFSSQAARDSFLQNPAHFVAQTGPLKVQTDIRKKEKVIVSKAKIPNKFLLSSSVQASCPADLFAWHPRVRQDHSGWVARPAAWHFPYSVQGATPNAHHGQDKGACTLFWWGGVSRGVCWGLGGSDKGSQGGGRGGDGGELRQHKWHGGQLQLTFSVARSRITRITRMLKNYNILTLKYCACATLCLQQEVILTDEETAIKAYLSDGDPLTPEILDMIIAPYWNQEPYM